MTNREALEVIERLGVDSRGYPKLKEALDMAIEALQRGLENVNADSCSEEPNRSDLISRQDALKVLMRKERDQYNDWKRSGDEHSLCAKKAYSSSIFAIYDLPSAEVRTQMSSADCISRQDAIDVAKQHWYKPDIAKALEELPSANIDLSGFCDRLWKSAYDRGHERCKDDVIDLLEKWSGGYEYIETETESAIKELCDLPSAQPELYCAPQPDLSDDGTLMMTVPNGMLNDVKRVMVDEVGTKFCKVMYQDEPERKKGRWIIDKDCEGKSRTITCNLCGHKEFNWHDPNYCQNCGADMRI